MSDSSDSSISGARWPSETNRDGWWLDRIATLADTYVSEWDDQRRHSRLARNRRQIRRALDQLAEEAYAYDPDA